MAKQTRLCPPQRAALVGWTARLGAVTAQAAAVHLGVSVASARAQLHAAARVGLLVAQRPLTDRPTLYGATRRGLRACGEPGLDPCRIGASGAHHLIVCAHAAAALERCYPDHRLLGERELRRDERLRGRALASAVLGEAYGGRELLHRPDLVLLPARPDEGLPVAVEVELTLKAPRRLQQICRAWARSRGVAGVLYLAPAPMRRALDRAIAQADAAERIAVLALDALPGLDADGAHAHAAFQRAADARADAALVYDLAPSLDADGAQDPSQ